MRTLGVVDDPVFKKRENHHFLNHFFLRLIKDERDLPFVYLCLQITFFIFPVAILLFSNLLAGWHWWLVALIYTGLVIYFVGPYTLMLHNTSHRQFFKHEYNFLNHYIPWVLGPLMGQSPGTYYSHHIGMHHAENNLPGDKSSTMKYQRDSIGDFLKYSVGFLFFGIVELIRYFRVKRIKKYSNMAMKGELFYIALCLLLAFINLKTTLYILILPMVIVRFSMMAGNWGQHAFIDKDTPANNYRNSITCINNAYNKKCFNDGYHIGHHLRPHMHWTDMPNEFVKNSDKYAEENAIVFEGLDFHSVWVLLMFRRYDVLARHFVNLGDRFQSKQEIETLLRSRTRKIDISQYS